MMAIIATKAVPVHPALTVFVHPCTAERSLCSVRQDPSSFTYAIHGCISVARGRMPEATTDVGEGREQDAEASYLSSLGMTRKSVNYFQGMMKDAEDSIIIF